MLSVLCSISFITWALLLFGGFIYGKPNAENTRRMPIWTRLGSSLALVSAAWLWAANLLFPYPILGTLGAPWIAIGMMLGFIGDIFMARSNVIGGMIAFGMGHIAYILGFIEFSNYIAMSLAVPSDPRTSLIIGFWLMVGFLGWAFVVWRKQEKRGVLHWAALTYCLLLSTTAGIASGIAVSYGGGLWLLALGAALFLLSDLIIAGRLFQKWSFPLIDDVIWLTYGPAQMLIVFVPPLVMGAIVSLSPL
jgi:hypothetical protein